MRSVIKVKPNGQLADQLRSLGLERLVDSPRVRSALGIPIREVKPVAKPMTPSATRSRYEAIAQDGLLWQRLQLLQEGEDEHLSDVGWQRDLATAEAEMGNYARAAEVWGRVEAMGDHTAQDCYAQAHCWLRAGEQSLSASAEARANARAREEGNPDWALLGLGGYYQRRGDWDYAARSYRRIFEEAHLRVGTNKENLAELAFNCGLAHDRCFEWSIAEDYYRYAVTMRPEKRYWSYKLGLSLERQGKWNDAAEAYLFAAHAAPEGDQTYWRYRASYCLHHAGSYQAACETFLGIPPGESSSPEGSGTRNSPSLPRTFSGPTVFDSALPCFSTYWEKLAESLTGPDEMPARIDALRAAVDRAQDHPTALLEKLGKAEFMLGDFESASRRFVDSRPFQRPDGIELKPYKSKTPIAFSARYTEYALSLPVRPDVVLFESFQGAQASCHPRAIFEAISADPRFEGHTFVWVLRVGEPVPEMLRERPNVVVAVRDSDLFHRYLATAGWLINNVTFPPYFVRRPEQHYLNTWHGTPIKTLGKDARPGYLQHANISRNFLQTTHMISPCTWTTGALMDRCDVRGIFTGQIAELGSPRSDAGIASSEADRLALRDRLGLHPETPVVLYAPTWRGGTDGGSKDVALSIEALSALDSVDDATVLFRGHHYSERALREAGLGQRLVPADIDTNELLAIVDVLITDYSSIFFDFLPFDRPIAFYTPDEQEYREERGLYFEVEELPGMVSRRVERLTEVVRELTTNPGADSRAPIREAWRERYAPHEDGNATARTIEFFFFGDNSYSVDLENQRPRVLMHAALSPNGITTSVQNLAASIQSGSATLVNVAAPDALQTVEGRKEQFDTFSEKVLHVGRVGAPAYSIEERWVIVSFNRVKRFFSASHRDLAMRAYAREFKRIFGPVEFDAAVEFDGYASFWAVLLAAAENVTEKLIFQHSDLHAEWTKKYPDLAAVFSQYQFFDRVVAVSPSICALNRDSLAAPFGVDPGKFVTAHNQINPISILERADAALDADVEAWLERTSGHTFVTMGRLSVEKAQDVLLRSFAEVAATTPSRLIVIGSGFLQPDLEKLAKRLGIRERVLFTGQRSNPMNIMRAADTFVLTSKHEGQPMVIGEAMMLGKRVISTDLPGTRDLLGDGHGRLVPHDIDAFAEAMRMAAAGSLDTKRFDAESYREKALREFAELCGVELPLVRAEEQVPG